MELRTNVEENLKLANQGNAKAQCQLGFYYFYGYRGLKKDIKQGFYWYKKAIDQGNKISQLALFDIYEKGNNVT